MEVGTVVSKKIDTKLLDEIIEKMVETVDHSKSEIFRISEQSLEEFEALSKELKEIKNKVSQMNEKRNKLEKQASLAKIKLSEVRRNFSEHSENEIRSAYEHAHEYEMKATVYRQMENQLRDRSDELERRLLSLNETIEKAEHLVGQISVILNYLNSDFRQFGEMIEDAKQKQVFGLRIIEAQEEERRKLSREIHDGPAQMLANVMLRSQLIDRVFREQGLEDGFKEIMELRKMVRTSLYEVRRIIFDLRPMALDDLGLIPTLKKYLYTIEDYNENTRINFKYLDSEKRIPAKFEVAIFRMVQEAVQNAIKHADATIIDVTLELGNQRVVVKVEDNGKGFDTKKHKEHSFGLMGMKERVELLYGQLSIESKIGAGTMISIDIPIEESLGL